MATRIYVLCPSQMKTVKLLSSMSANNAIKNDTVGRIDDLRRQINLAESKKKVAYDEGEEAKVKNKEYALKLKDDIGKLKIKASKNVFELTNIDHPIKSLLVHQKKTEEIMDLLNQWTEDMKKQHNLVLHNRHVNEDKLLELRIRQQEILKLKQSEGAANQFELLNELKKTQELENNFEKLQMKIMEGELVQKKYLSIKKILDDEILQLQKDIRSVDDDVDKHKMEIPRLQLILQNALQSNQTMELQLLKREKQFHRQKYNWERMLMMCQQQEQEIHVSDEDKADLLPSSTALSFEESSQNTTEGIPPINDVDKNLLEQMKIAAGSDKEEFSKLLAQGETKHRLAGIKDHYEQKLLQLQNDKQDLKAELENAKLSLEKKSNEHYEQLGKKLTEETERKLHVINQMEEHVKLIDELFGALRQLCVKISQGCKLPSKLAATPSPDDTVDLLMMCTERVEVLAEQCRDYDRSSATKMYQGMRYTENIEEAQLVLKPKKKSQQFEEPILRVTKSIEDCDVSTDQDMMTRAMIKRQAKMLIDHNSKLHPKGSQAQKKGKGN